MSEQLIIQGNELYEIDLECMACRGQKAETVQETDEFRIESLAEEEIVTGNI